MHSFRTHLLATTAMLALSGGAYAADLAVKAPPVAPPPPVTNWTGFYAGLQIGGASFDPSCHTTNSAGFVGGFDDFADPCFVEGEGVQHSGSLSSGSVIGGGKIGYDWQWNKVVFGVVGEFDWTHLNPSTQSTVNFFDAGTTAGASEKIQWLASARGRVGWAFDNVLFYATGGVAWTQIKAGANLSDPLDPDVSWSSQTSTNKTGAVAGGGFEYRVTQNVSVVGELLWYGFGTVSASATNTVGTTYTTQFNNQDILTGTLGVNWRF